MSLSVSLTNTIQPEQISPLYTDGIGNWFEFSGSITGGTTTINDANLIIDIQILDQTKTSPTIIDTPGRFKIPCRENGKFIFNSENIVKNYVTYPYNDSTDLYYNGLTYSYELVADPYFLGVTFGSAVVNGDYNHSWNDFLLSTTYSIGGGSLTGRNLRVDVPSYGSGFIININSLGAGNSIASSSIGSNGSGYSVGETFLVNGGTFQATGTITSIGSVGNVLSYSIGYPGQGYTLSSKSTTATSPRDNYLQIYGLVNGLTNSNIFTYPGLYYVNIDFAIQKPASAPPLEIDFTMGGTTIAKTYSTSGSYSFRYDYLSPGGSVGMGLQMAVVPDNATNSSVFYFHGSVQPTSGSMSTTPLYINESTPVGSTSTNFPNFAYELDSYVKYNMKYGLEFDPKQNFLFVSGASSPHTIFSSYTTDNTVQPGDIITTLPDSTIFSYFSQTSTVLSVTPAGPFSFIETDMIYATPSTTNITGKITSIQRQIGTTSTLLGYNGVRDYFQKETAQAYPNNSILMNKFDLRDNVNNEFLSNYGYDQYHCIPIKPGQGERVRFATDFLNNSTGGTGFQIQTLSLGAGNSIVTFSISSAGSGYVVGQIIRLNAGGIGTQANAWMVITSVNGSGGVTGATLTDGGLGYSVFSIVSTTGGYTEQDPKYVISMIDPSGNETILRQQQVFVQNPGSYTTGIYTICMFDENNTIPIIEGYKYRIDYYAFRFQPFVTASLWYIGVEDCISTGYDNTRIKFLDKNGSWAYCNFNKDKKEIVDITRNEYRQSLPYNYSLNPAISGYSVDKLRGANLLSVQEQKSFVINSDWVDEDYYAYLIDNLWSSRQVFEFYDTYTFVDGSTASAVNIPIILTSKQGTKKTLNRDKAFNLQLEYKYAHITTQNI